MSNIIRRIQSILFLFLIPAVASAQPREVVINGVDALVSESGKKALQILRDDRRAAVLAVYYFTADGKVSPLSDYLINGITTELANGVKKEKLPVDIVSRQHLDALLKELSFQLSDLADQKKQLSLGKQLGADTILVGTLAQVGDTYRLNCQLVRVETGLVVGGYILSFRVEADIAKKLGLDKTGVSEVIVIEDKAVEQGGYATATTIFENFNGAVLNVNLGHDEELYGERKATLSGTTGVAKDGGSDKSPCAQFRFQGNLDGTMLETDWHESGLDFYAILKTQMKPADFHGLNLSLKPVGFNQIELYLTQEHGGETVFFGLSLTLNENQWQDLKIPFSHFYIDAGPDQATGRLDPAKPVGLTVMVPYYDNFYSVYFRTRDVAATLFVDNVGMFKIKGNPDPALVASWNDGVSRLPFKVDLQGVLLWQDYALIEALTEEEAAGIDSFKKVPGIKGERIGINRIQGPANGSALEIAIDLDVDKSFLDFMTAHPDYGMYLALSAQPGRAWQGFKGLEFFLRSVNVVAGALSLEIVSGPEEEHWFSAEVIGSETWSRVRIPFSELSGEADDDNLAALTTWSARPTLYLEFEIPASVLQAATQNGKISLGVALDDFVLVK